MWGWALRLQGSYLCDVDGGRDKDDQGRCAATFALITVEIVLSPGVDCGEEEPMDTHEEELGMEH